MIGALFVGFQAWRTLRAASPALKMIWSKFYTRDKRDHAARARFARREGCHLK